MSIVESVRRSIVQLQHSLVDNAPRREHLVPTLPLASLEQPLFAQDEDEESCLAQLLLTALKVLYAAFPTMVSFQLNIANTLLNIYLVGNLFTPGKLAAVGLGAILGNMVGYFVIESINMGMGAESIRAFGKQNHRVIGLMYQRGIAINFIICILLTPVLYMSDKILLGLGYNQQIVQDATIYVWGLVPSFYLYAFYDTTKNYLQAQSVVYIPVIIQACTTVLHYYSASFFIRNYSLIGAAWAKNISDALNSLLLYLYVVFQEPTRESWIEWTSDAVHNLADYLAIVMSTGITSYLQTLAFQILCVIAAHLDDEEQLAAQIAISNTLLAIFLCEIGISHCLINVISQSLAEGRLPAARRRALMGVFISLSVGVVICVEMLQYEEYWISFFTRNEVVIALLRDNQRTIFAIIILDFLQMALSSVLKALDLHQLVLRTYLYCFYLAGLLLAIFFGFRLELGLFGLWLGWCLGLLAAILLFLRHLCAVDWTERYNAIIKLY